MAFLMKVIVAFLLACLGISAATPPSNDALTLDDTIPLNVTLPLDGGLPTNKSATLDTQPKREDWKSAWITCEFENKIIFYKFKITGEGWLRREEEVERKVKTAADEVGMVTQWKGAQYPPQDDRNSSVTITHQQGACGVSVRGVVGTVLCLFSVAFTCTLCLIANTTTTTTALAAAAAAPVFPPTTTSLLVPASAPPSLPTACTAASPPSTSANCISSFAQIPRTLTITTWKDASPNSHRPPAEVRVEVGLFYGDLVTIEAKYPGLDYCYGPHRMRLGRFPHHARLFAAFDELNLTYQEIQDFCCWEGTRWARERYEKDEGCTIEDTTGDHIPLFVDPKQRQNEPRRGSIVRKTDISIVFQDAPADLRTRRSRTSQQQAVVYIPSTSEDPAEEDEDDEEDDQEDTNMSDSASDTTASPHSEQASTTTAEWNRARAAHIEDLERQRNAAIHDQIQAALAQGAPLTPEQEQLLKDQREQNASRQLDVARSVGYSQRALAGEASASARAAA
ncbi:hypothetical protein MBLNU13_g01753t2 [Cladosporium sp. NU13]